ncbi:MAG TPA: sensor histidine kinase [Pseudoneobacillus sp.]|nr:sensor histidine kinase [Pseudoneobacillus sp.]
MIKKYLVERRSWILLFLFLQVQFLFITYLDSSIPITSVLYMIFLSFIIFILFLIIRFQKETSFYQSLKDWQGDLDIMDIAEATSPFEKTITDRITKQTKCLKQQSDENLLRLEQEKDELLAWIHEVKTPLTTMNLIIDRIDDEKLKAQLIFEWLRIHHLLDQQLHQSRIPFIQNDIYIENVDLENLIYKEIKSLQSWCIQKGIGFDLDIQSSEVLSDGKWLAFILRQLITNAVKYSEASDIMIKSYQHHHQVMLEIQDFGSGIDPKDLMRIFDKGFTSTTNHLDQAATGMGLFLAKKAAESLLIRIDVESELAKGTTFTLTFPKRNEFVQITSM